MSYLLVIFQDTFAFTSPVEAGEDIEGVITLRAPINGVTRHDIMVCVVTL